jgi:formate/nitrite transporter FocA (FNT family)
MPKIVWTAVLAALFVGIILLVGVEVWVDEDNSEAPIIEAFGFAGIILAILSLRDRR